MNTLKNVFLLAVVILFSSCAATVIFPTSAVAPAADITSSKKADKNGNYSISITAKNLASPDRLDPHQSVYVAWIVTDTEGTKNIGRLINKNAQTATLETLTPFEFTEIFITAEGLADISYPTGIEIARARFKK